MSSTQNPYEKFLAGRDPQEVIADTPQTLSALSQQLGPEGMEQSYAPGKWSARQIICHLADCEIVFSFRLRQTLAEPHHVIQPFDQELWAKPYAGFDVQLALDIFRNLRQWNLGLLRTLTPTDYDKPVTHPERGAMTFRAIVSTMAGHDLNHLDQLKSIPAPPGNQ